MSIDKFNRSHLHFDYFSENYLRFEQDYYEYTKLETPLTFIGDDLLMSMAKSQRNYFKLHRNYATDQRDHYFIFKVRTPEEGKLVRVYEYIEHRLVL